MPLFEIIPLAQVDEQQLFPALEQFLDACRRDREEISEIVFDLVVTCIDWRDEREDTERSAEVRRAACWRGARHSVQFQISEPRSRPGNRVSPRCCSLLPAPSRCGTFPAASA